MLHLISSFLFRKIFLKTLSSSTQKYCEKVNITLMELNMLLKVQKKACFKTKTVMNRTETSPYYPRKVNPGVCVKLV